MARLRKTKAFGDLGDRMLERIDPRKRRYAARAVEVWAEIAGADIAQHTLGSALRESGELVVYVDSSTWASELALMSERLKDGINERIGQELVRSIRFTVSRRVGDDAVRVQAEKDSDEFYEADATPPVSLDESERAQAEYVASVVTDEELRETALRVMVKDLEWKKGQRVAKTAEEAPEAPERPKTDG
ncbi:MAG: DUF721 domain-containing protein [Anaerosomatales bacterium]|nr:DUF721 domain-containing protein [Anaerosomatales bacterium]